MNPKVDNVHSAEKRWRSEFAKLRSLCLGTGMIEELKWGKACYTLADDQNVVLIHGFKDYCALLFMKGALMNDPAHMLIQQTQSVQAARQLRFSSLDDIKNSAAVIKSYLEEAMAVARSGEKVKLKPVSAFAVPAEFQEQLDGDQPLAEAFELLTPGRRKGYLLYFAEAKKSATRSARISKHRQRILNGKGLDD